MNKYKGVTRRELENTNFKPQQLSKVGIDPDKVDFLRFSNLRSFAAYVNEIKDVKTYRDSSHTGDRSFTGTSTFDEALDLIMKPYGEPPYAIKTRVEEIEQKIRNNLHKKGLLTDWIAEDYMYDVEGVEIDIAKLIEGDPECYLKPNKKYKDHFYDLNINVAVAYTQSTDTIINAFCKVIAVVHSLEKRGHKIRLFASSVTKNATSERHSIIDVCIKNFDEFVDIKAMARIIYPSFLRRVVFKVEEVKYQRDLASGYGKAVNDLKGVITLDSSLKEEELLNRIVAEYVANYKED
jgi:hypothetical protein